MATLSAGCALSTRSPWTYRVTVCGVWPAGMSSGDSCSFTICLSVKRDLLCTRARLWLVWRLEQSVGSAILPCLISTSAVFL